MEDEVLLPRRPVKKRELSAKESDQRRRREELLRSQRQRRAQMTADWRGMEAPPPSGAVAAPPEPLAPQPPAPEAVVDDDMGGGGEDAATGGGEADGDGMQVEPRGARGRGGKRGGGAQRAAASRELAATLMSPEWLVDIPTDLASRWYVAARPAGKRCLLCSGGGKTSAHGRSGWFRTLPSALPGGARSGGNGGGGGGSGRCELDCIWSEPLQAFFVLDVLCWKGHRLLDCPAEFRLYWLQAKLAELPRLATASSTNPCRVLPLPWYAASPDALRHCYAWRAELDDGSTGARDGLLLMHRDALYEGGAPSPLQLSWSDAGCSERFYDYGSERMAREVARQPDKAGRWRTAEVEAAWTFADILECAEQPPMEAEAEAGMEAAPVPLAEEAEMAAAEAVAAEAQADGGDVVASDAACDAGVALGHDLARGDVNDTDVAPMY